MHSSSGAAHLDAMLTQNKWLSGTYKKIYVISLPGFPDVVISKARVRNTWMRIRFCTPHEEVTNVYRILVGKFNCHFIVNFPAIN
jgi:hypothetical protein